MQVQDFKMDKEVKHMMLSYRQETYYFLREEESGRRGM